MQSEQTDILKKVRAWYNSLREVFLGTRFSRELRARSFAALTAHRAVIHYRSYFESLFGAPKKESNT